MRTLTVSQASIAGRDHVALRRGCQDAVASGRSGAGAFGVVSDGCGSAPKSEVGAALTVAVVERWLGLGLAHGLSPEMAVADTLQHLLRALAATVGATVGARRRDVNEARWRFVRDHLLATVVGFCSSGEEALVFAWGDGVVLVNDQTWVLDQRDRPDYPAYALLRCNKPGDAQLASPFPVEKRRFRAGDVRRIAVATDGFDPELLPHAFGKRSSALTRWMRIQARAGHFRDDASVALLEVGS